MHATAVPQSSTWPSYPRWSEPLRDHSYVRIRPANPRAEPGELWLLETSPGARRFCLLGMADYPGHQLSDRPTGIVYANEAAFVAVTPEDSRERIVAASRYRTDHEGLHCECVVAISDDWQHKGLAALLMKHLIEVARAQGIRRMTCVDPAANVQMKDLTTQLGFRTRTYHDDARLGVLDL